MNGGLHSNIVRRVSNRGCSGNEAGNGWGEKMSLEGESEHQKQTPRTTGQTNTWMRFRALLDCSGLIVRGIVTANLANSPVMMLRRPHLTFERKTEPLSRRPLDVAFKWKDIKTRWSGLDWATSCCPTRWVLHFQGVLATKYKSVLVESQHTYLARIHHLFSPFNLKQKELIQFQYYSQSTKKHWRGWANRSIN